VRIAHTRRSQKPKQLGIRIQKPLRAFVRPAAETSSRERGEKKKKKTEKRGEAAGFLQKNGRKTSKDFLPHDIETPREK
jgi:hypothetical protein